MKRTMPCESPGLAARMPREQWLNRYLGDTSVSLTEGCISKGGRELISWLSALIRTYIYLYNVAAFDAR